MPAYVDIGPPLRNAGDYEADERLAEDVAEAELHTEELEVEDGKTKWGEQKRARIGDQRQRITKSQEDQSQEMLGMIIRKGRAKVDHLKAMRDRKYVIMKEHRAMAEELKGAYETRFIDVKKEFECEAEIIYLKQRELREKYEEQMKGMKEDREREMALLGESQKLRLWDLDLQSQVQMAGLDGATEMAAESTKSEGERER
jgi:hypothetical protein